MSNKEELSEFVINADGAALPKNLEAEYLILHKNYNKIVDTNKVQSNMLTAIEKQRQADEEIIKSLEACVVKQHDRIKELNQTLLIFKQGIERVLR